LHRERNGNESERVGVLSPSVFKKILPYFFRKDSFFWEWSAWHEKLDNWPNVKTYSYFLFAERLNTNKGELFIEIGKKKCIKTHIKK